MRVFAICSSISAKAFTARLPAITMPDNSAAVMKIDDCQSFIVRVKRFQNPSCALSSAFSLANSAFTCLIFAVCAFHAADPRSIYWSCRFSVCSARFSSFGVARFSLRITLSTCIVEDSISRICRRVSVNSFRSLRRSVLLPAAAARAIADSSCRAFCRSCCSTCIGC